MNPLDFLDYLIDTYCLCKHKYNTRCRQCHECGFICQKWRKQT